MADLMIPIFIIVVMFLVIETLESPLFLLLLSLMFFPISLLFAASASSYDKLFTADITPWKNNIVFASMMGGVMAMIPLSASLRLIYLHKGWGEALPEGTRYAKSDD